MKNLILIGCLLLAALAACSDGAGPPAETGSDSVWAVDLVQTLPGRQAEYLRSIEANWASARRMAREDGAIRSYRALSTEPDSSRGWDVILMTEYTSATTHADREATFKRIFASPEFVLTPTRVPSTEMRTFMSKGVVMKEVVASPVSGARRR